MHSEARSKYKIGFILFRLLDIVRLGKKSQFWGCLMSIVKSILEAKKVDLSR